MRQEEDVFSQGSIADSLGVLAAAEFDFQVQRRANQSLRYEEVDGHVAVEAELEAVFGEESLFRESFDSADEVRS